MKDLEPQLIDFVKYIKEVHTDQYGQLQICDNGDELDPTVERVVKEYLKTIEEPKQVKYSEDEVIKLLISCKNRFGGSELYDYTHDDEVKEWFKYCKK
jgi:hypothetical protein